MDTTGLLNLLTLKLNLAYVEAFFIIYMCWILIEVNYVLSCNRKVWNAFAKLWKATI